MKNRLLLTLVTLLFAAPTYAQIFKFSSAVDCGTSDPAVCAAFTGLLNDELAKVETDINKGLPGGSPDRFMKGMANSSVMAGKGVGTDYASYMDVFLVGAGIGVGVDMEKSKDPESDISGLGVAPGVVVGLNLGVLPVRSIFGLESNRLNLYVNYMGFDKDQDFDKSSAGIETTTFGTHLRYDWIRPRGNKVFGWGGVKIHTGYEYNNTKLNFKTAIDETISGTDSGAGVSINSTNLTGSPEASIKVATHSIPLELSTDIRFLYFLSLYTGLGVDFNFGQAKGDGALNANDIAVTCTGVVCNGAGATVTPEANIDSSGSVNSVLSRGFLGVQFNIPFVRIFVQADKAFGNDLVGATAGLRVAY